MNSRRQLLQRIVRSSTLLLAAACGPGQQAGAPAAAPTSATAGTADLRGATVTLLQWNHFIPTADPFFKQQAEEWGKQTGASVTIETINANDLTPRFTPAL